MFIGFAAAGGLGFCFSGNDDCEIVCSLSCFGFPAFFKDVLNGVVKADNIARTNRVCIYPVKL